MDKLICRNIEFTVIKLLGKGKGGYSYLAEDCCGNRAVYKQIHYEPCDTYTFGDNKLLSELRDYERLKDVGIAMPKLLFHDNEKQCLVKEYIDGKTLAAIVASNELKDSYIRQIFAMCNKLYANNLNIDYFPTNFVVSNDIVYYIDYECNTYMQEWDFEQWGIWFLANSEGWEKHFQTGDHKYLSVDAKPHKQGFEEIVAYMLSLKE